MDSVETFVAVVTSFTVGLMAGYLMCLHFENRLRELSERTKDQEEKKKMADFHGGPGY